MSAAWCARALVRLSEGKSVYVTPPRGVSWPAVAPGSRVLVCPVPRPPRRRFGEAEGAPKDGVVIGPVTTGRIVLCKAAGLYWLWPVVSHRVLEESPDSPSPHRHRYRVGNNRMTQWISEREVLGVVCPD